MEEKEKKLSSTNPSKSRWNYMEKNIKAMDQNKIRLNDFIQWLESSVFDIFYFFFSFCLSAVDHLCFFWLFFLNCCVYQTNITLFSGGNCCNFPNSIEIFHAIKQFIWLCGHIGLNSYIELNAKNQSVLR